MDASGNVMTGMKDDEVGEEEEEGLHPQDIDAYWLQRRLAKAYEETGNPIDADKSQQLANDVFSILQACFLVHGSEAATVTEKQNLHLGAWQYACLVFLLGCRIPVQIMPAGHNRPSNRQRKTLSFSCSFHPSGWCCRVMTTGRLRTRW